MRGKNRSIGLMIFLLAIGVVIGGVVGDLLGDKVPLLSYSYPIGLKQPVYLDLSVIRLTFGLLIDINVASVIGLGLSYYMYRKL